MSLHSLTRVFPWSIYSQKLKQAILRPYSSGSFELNDAIERGMRLIIGEAGSKEEGNFVRFYWLVDNEDGIIVDSRFQVYGQSALIGAAEVACRILVNKNYMQAQRIAGDVIDMEVRDNPSLPAFPEDTYSHINLVLDAIDQGASQCTDIPVAATYDAPPMGMGEELDGNGYPGWEELSHDDKLRLVEEVIARDIRAYVEMDGGGVDVVALENNDTRVIITYSGACNGCFSATGATLSAIQQRLRSALHPDLEVVPDMDIFGGA